MRVVVAEDHQLMRKALVALVTEHLAFNVVGEARDGIEAVSMWHERKPDLGLFDLRMPRMDGAEAVGLIRARHPHAAVIILSLHDRSEDVQRSMRAGARGFVDKGASLDELDDCVAAIARGQRYLPHVLSRTLAGNLDYGTLSPRELQVLRGLALGKANKTIARELTIGEGTVKGHVRHLFDKLRVTSRTEAVTLGLQRGLIELGPLQ